MNLEIHRSLIRFSKIDKSYFQSLLNAGGFYFEERADYTTLLVSTVSDGLERVASHIQQTWLKSLATDEKVGE
jgi:hypothetical protein